MLSGLTKLNCPIHTTVLLSEAKDPRAKRSAPRVPHGCRQLLVCAARNGFAGGCSIDGPIGTERMRSIALLSMTNSLVSLTTPHGKALT